MQASSLKKVVLHFFTTLFLFLGGVGQDGSGEGWVRGPDSDRFFPGSNPDRDRLVFDIYATYFMRGIFGSGFLYLCVAFYA